MLQLSTATMNGSRNPTRSSRSRTSTPDRGGIRKRGGTTRTDRDGDLDMASAGGASGRGRGRKTRGQNESSRRTTTNAPSRAGRRPAGEKDRTLDALQKAIFSSASPQANVRSTRSRPGGMALDGVSSEKGGLVQLRVRGWKTSKAATNPDGGIESLVGFLEKKALPPDPNASAHVRLKISKSRVEGDALIISVRPEQVDWVLRINGFIFAGAPLTIELNGKRGATGSPGATGGPSQAAVDTKAKMTNFLSKRYSEPRKLLDLSNLGTDPDLVEMGMFNSVTTESKFFPALMKVCELTFDSPEKRKTAVESVSLSNNQLVTVATVTTLSQTFPDLKNLDLSNNQLKDTQSLNSWRWKFRNLDFLDLSGNPISTEANFKETMLKWYPKLRILNNSPVRTPEEIAAQKKTPIPVLGPSFQDESHIAENFVKAFFVGFDNDRNDLLNGIYDSNSIFSFNVNTSAPRALQTEPPPSWDSYIRKSRNLQKINHLAARMSRSFVGTESIREAWSSLPKTKHPDILTSPKDWLIECHPIPTLPDPAGQSSTGVGGLLITVHGKFDELDKGTGNKVQTRSFDRTFVLGPGGGIGGLRVSNDMLCLRAFGDCQAWVPEAGQGPPLVAAPPQPAATDPHQATPSQATPVPAATVPSGTPHPEAKEGYGMPAPGKPDEQVKKEQLVLEISFRTKMTLGFSEMALTGNNWDLTAALKNFEELKTQGQLPANAYLPVP